MTTALLIIHGLVAVALLGAITPPDIGDMGAGARVARFVFRPISRRAVRLIRERHHRSVCGIGAAGRDRVLVLPRRHQARLGARRPLACPRPLRSQGAFRRYRVGAAAGLLGLLAAAGCRRTRPNASRPDLGPCLHRLVELSDRSRREQHQRLRVITSSHAFRNFAFAYGTAFAVFYVVALKLDVALFTVYPSLGVVLLGTHHSGDVVGPSMAFLAPAMYWYGWTATAALGALMVGLVAAFFPSDGRDGSGWDGCGWSRRLR